MRRKEEVGCPRKGHPVSEERLAWNWDWNPGLSWHQYASPGLEGWVTTSPAMTIKDDNNATQHTLRTFSVVSTWHPMPIENPWEWFSSCPSTRWGIWTLGLHDTTNCVSQRTDTGSQRKDEQRRGDGQVQCSRTQGTRQQDKGGAGRSGDGDQGPRKRRDLRRAPQLSAGLPRSSLADKGYFPVWKTLFWHWSQTDHFPSGILGPRSIGWP